MDRGDGEQLPAGIPSCATSRVWRLAKEHSAYGLLVCGDPPSAVAALTPAHDPLAQSSAGVEDAEVLAPATRALQAALLDVPRTFLAHRLALRKADSLMSWRFWVSRTSLSGRCADQRFVVARVAPVEMPPSTRRV